MKKTNIFLKLGIAIAFFLSTPITFLYAKGSTGDMNLGRWGHSASFMPSLDTLEGPVLITGGYSNILSPTVIVTNTAEIYSPHSKSYYYISRMNKNRVFHQAITLKDGTVLVMGGRTDVAGNATSSCEIYDPAIKSFSYTDSMSYKRVWFTATLLSTGEVLVAGGDMLGTGTGNEAEIYNPKTKKWRKVASMKYPRIGHCGISLSVRPDSAKDKILVTGGNLPVSLTMGKLLYNNSTEVYNYATDNWESEAFMNYPRGYHIIERLEGISKYGNQPVILVAGGYSDTTATGSNNFITNSAELYIPSQNKWVKTVSMNSPRVYHTSNPMGECNTDVLVAGGLTTNLTYIMAKDIELFHFIGGNIPVWFKGPDMLDARSYHTAIRLLDGSGGILISGGAGNGFRIRLRKSELIP